MLERSVSFDKRLKFTETVNPVNYVLIIYGKPHFLKRTFEFSQNYFNSFVRLLKNREY